MKSIAVLAAAAMSLAMSTLAAAQVQVSESWVRASVPGQMGTGAFMQLTSRQDAKLVKVVSPIAEIAEIHEMRLENEIMKMRPIEQVVLPAGKTVALKSGGFHVMLMGLKQQVRTGDQVPLTLTFEYEGGRKETISITAPAQLSKP